MKERERGTVRARDGRFYFRVRLMTGTRPEVRLVGATNELEADAIADWLVDLVEALEQSGRLEILERTVKQAAAAKTEKARKLITEAVRKLAGGERPITHELTFAKFAERWTSGDLSKAYPDHVARKDWSDDVSRLTRYINPKIGDLPLSAVRLEDCERVMRDLPSMSPANRRHVAQVMVRVLNLAAWPARLIPSSPLPRGFLPKKGARKALAFLYPDEEALLVGYQAAPEAERLAFGILAREGMREDELLSAEWWQFDLKRGVFTLDENKTNDPRLWALRPDTVRALTIWKKRFGETLARPFVNVVANHLPDRMRAYLEAAGVDRKELFTATANRVKLRTHDLRATFVTLALANGRSEAWIKLRTGHRSSEMIAAYTRQAKTFAELELGELHDLVEALGWGIDWGKLLAGPIGGDEVTAEECTGRDSNPHALRRRNLNSSRAPRTIGKSAKTRAAAPSEDTRSPTSPTDPPRLPPGLRDAADGLANLRAADALLELAIFQALMSEGES